MGLLYPAGLALLALVPLLVLAYFTRRRPLRAVVSSAMIFRALAGSRRERLARRPRFDWTFFVELALLILAALAVAGPYLIRPSRPIAVVFDNSAAMQVVTPSGKTRFALALDRLGERLRSEAASDRTTVYLTAAQPHLMHEPFSGPLDALNALHALRLTDAPDDDQAVTSLLDDLASSGRFHNLIYVGAAAIATPIPAGVTAIAVGAPTPNFAIGSFTIRREVFGARALHARLTVANFSPAARDLEVTLSADGKAVATAPVHLEANDVAAVDFSNLAPADTYRAALKPGDAFMLDNVAYASAASVRPVSILFISPTPADAIGLGAIPGVKVATVAPRSFTPADLASVDVAVFEYTAPKEMPSVNTLLVMPPGGDPLFGLNPIATGPTRIAQWSTVGALTDSVNFRLLNIRAGELFPAHPWMQPVVSGDRGALLMRGERGGHRFVAAGFNPFPYLGRKNLPMSVLTLNILSYLSGIGAQSAAWHTGEPFLVPAGIVAITGPSGETTAVKPGTLFAATARQGVYRMADAAGATTTRAVNLGDLNASNLDQARLLKLEVTGPGPAGLRSTLTTRHPLAAYLILLIVLLAAIEALVLYRRSRQTAEARG